MLSDTKIKEIREEYLNTEIGFAGAARKIEAAVVKGLTEAARNIEVKRRETIESAPVEKKCSFCHTTMQDRDCPRSVSGHHHWYLSPIDRYDAVRETYLQNAEAARKEIVKLLDMQEDRLWKEILPKLKERLEQIAWYGMFENEKDAHKTTKVRLDAKDQEVIRLKGIVNGCNALRRDLNVLAEQMRVEIVDAEAKPVDKG